MDFDAVIIGAGTAGSVAALNLAPFRRVIVLERVAAPAWRIGESVPGATRRLLSDMGLWDGFVEDGHLPRHALCSTWGSGDPIVRDALSDPDGHGWQIDRVRFETGLRSEAVRRGAILVCPALATRVERAGDGWIVGFNHPMGRRKVAARLIIDAAGRGSRCLVPHGASRRNADRLVCAWIRARGVALPAGVAQIEAEAEGWWYAAPLPDDAGILAFHTDATSTAARAGRTLPGLLARARKLPMLGCLLAYPGWDRGEVGYCGAHGAWLDRAAGEDWLAAGDAAIAFDPLAAGGLFNAMYLGLSAAEAAECHLAGDCSALAQYAGEVAAVRDTYVAQHRAWYGLETRWAGEPFWMRRQASAHVVPS